MESVIIIGLGIAGALSLIKLGDYLHVAQKRKATINRRIGVK